MTNTFTKQVLALLLCAVPVFAAVKTEVIEYSYNGVTFEGYAAYRDDVPGKRPGVLIAHAWKGLGDYEKSRAKQLAEMGYVAFALDIYGKGVRPTTAQDAGQLAGFYKKNRPLLRIRAQKGLEAMNRLPNVDMSQTAIIGYCFGGTTALELARDNAPIVGAVSFHGGLSNPTVNKSSIAPKILVLHGAEDPFVQADEVAAFEQEMIDSNADWQLIKYSGAVHAFSDPNSGTDKASGAAYNEKADRRSFEAMKDFFKEIFTIQPIEPVSKVEIPEKNQETKTVNQPTKKPVKKKK